ncbi:hypothetical protein J4457_00235 [Candidatus Woesearchaeota archaeon]|nr:hypothetical protein [Candidatus Woesearchaeota archaeon]
MKYVHNVRITVFIKQEEDYQKNKAAFLSLVPFSLEDEKISLNERNVVGFHEVPIKILEVVLEKERHVKSFLDQFLSKLSSEQKEMLLRQKESRLDDENFFFIRLDKDHLMDHKEYFVIDGGNCFHIKMHIAAFPASRENALKVVDTLLKS